MYSVYCFRESIHRNKNQKVTNLQLSSHSFQHCVDVRLELWVFVLQHQVPSPGGKLCIDKKNHTSTLKSEAANRADFKNVCMEEIYDNLIFLKFQKTDTGISTLPHQNKKAF